MFSGPRPVNRGQRHEEPLVEELPAMRSRLFDETIGIEAEVLHRIEYARMNPTIAVGHDDAELGIPDLMEAGSGRFRKHWR
jgi:hypothetical protein